MVLEVAVKLCVLLEIREILPIKSSSDHVAWQAGFSNHSPSLNSSICSRSFLDWPKRSCELKPTGQLLKENQVALNGIACAALDGF